MGADEGTNQQGRRNDTQTIFTQSTNENIKKSSESSNLHQGFDYTNNK